MTFLDYSVLGIYLMLTIFIGIFVAKKQKNEDDLFTAGRSMGWIPVGISVMVTAFSAVNYVAFSGEVFSHGLYVLLCLPVFIIVGIPVNRIIIPFFYNMNLSTAYEYLEKRFDKRVRILASIIFIIWRVFWGATILYVPSKILSAVTGLNVNLLITIIGSSVLLYTMYGGIHAVMLTDTLQFFVLFSGIIIGILVAAGKVDGGFTAMFEQGVSAGLAKPFYPFDTQIFSLNPTIRITLWSCTIGTFVAFLTRYGADQVVVQRYFTATSVETAKKGFRLNIVSALFSLSLLAVFGFAIYSNAVMNGTIGQWNKPLMYFADFIKMLPVGITGLIVAGLFAATMSSIDSAANSCSRAFLSDIYRFSSKKISGLFQARVVTFIFGISIMLLSVYIKKLGSVFEIANKIVNGFGSPLLALFILGFFSKRANSKGLFWGGIIGAIWSAFVSLFVSNLALHYYAVVNFAGTFFICWIFSIVENKIYNPPTQLQISWMYRKQS